jgi:hypothetical protein
MAESAEKVLDLTFTYPVIIDAEDLIIPTWDAGGAIEIGGPANAMYLRAWDSIWANAHPDTDWWSSR